MSETTSPQNMKHTPRVAQALVGAVERGDAQEVSAMLAAGAFADARTAEGETPLMRAAAKGFDDVARVLLDAGADPRARRPDGFTPLLLAAFFNHEETARLLLARGADPSARTSLGTTAASWAASRGFTRMAELLKEAEAASLARKEEGRAAVTVEVKHDAAEEVEEIAEAPPPKREVFVPFESLSATQRQRTSGGFFRSWQASVGAVLLLAAFGVVAFSVWRTSKSARLAGQNPAPAQTPLQAITPQPTAEVLAATPTPTPDLQGYVGPQGPIVVIPGTAEPVLVSPAAPPSSAPGVPALISESGATEEATTNTRRPVATPTPRAADPSATPGGRPSEERRGEGAGASDRRTQTPNPEPIPRPSVQPSSPSAAAPPAPTPTPERRKVIPWPPQ